MNDNWFFLQCKNMSLLFFSEVLIKRLSTFPFLVLLWFFHVYFFTSPRFKAMTQTHKKWQTFSPKQLTFFWRSFLQPLSFDAFLYCKKIRFFVFFVKPRLENEGGDDEEKISHWWPKKWAAGILFYFPNKERKFFIWRSHWPERMKMYSYLFKIISFSKHITSFASLAGENILRNLTWNLKC